MAEKKKRIIGLLISVFSVALMVSFISPVFGSGWIRVISEGENIHKYKAYLLIGGNAADDCMLSEVYFGDGITPEFWEDAGMKDAGAPATKCAEWLAMMAENDTDGKFAVSLAVSQGIHEIPAAAEFTSADSAELKDGYYLIISEDTQPILVLMGNGNTITLNEKSTAPVISKMVREDDSEDYRNFDDAGMGEKLHYLIICTLPSNYNAYWKYQFVIHDRICQGIRIDKDTISISIRDEEGNIIKDITDRVLTDLYDDELIITCENLTEIFSDALGTEKINVTYSAELDIENACAGADSNDNYAYLEYRTSPVSEKMGITKEAVAKVYTWDLELVKRSAETDVALQNACFSVMDGYGRFLNTDGTLSDKKTEQSLWNTDKDGKINIRCIDTGIYTITEEKAPAGYLTAEPMVITIGAEYGEDNITGEADIKGTDCKLEIVDAKTGNIRAEVHDEMISPKENSVPHTDDISSPEIYIRIAICAAAVSGVGLLAGYLRKRSDIQKRKG